MAGLAGLTLDSIPQGGHVFLLGAHCDDIEIGCGATLAQLAAGRPDLRFLAIVFCSDEEREAECRSSFRSLFDGSDSFEFGFGNLRDGFLAYNAIDAKEFLIGQAQRAEPNLVFTHYRQDLHQDHRLVSDITYQVFRNSLILEMEIPKYDGDLGRPNVYFPVDDQYAIRKISTLMEHYASQSGKDWFTGDTFEGLMRLRGIECQSPSGKAEAYYASRIVIR